MLAALRHWLTPHHTNNYRPRLLHHFGLTLIIALFISFNSLTRLLESSPLHILGFTSSITADEVIQQTNLERLALGLPELKVSQKLTQAAQAKARYMFAHDFWSHIAPDGTTPWQFILDAGYNYTYAGENLAKDFSATPNLMRAWMSSPTHKANIVSSHYTDIGVAVVPGKLQGKDTVLVVQMFGATQASTQSSTSSQVPVVAQIEIQPQSLATSSSSQSIPLNLFNAEKTISLFILTLLLLVLIADLVIAESQNLSRQVGDNWAHIIFINVVLLAISFIKAGHIL